MTEYIDEKQVYDSQKYDSIHLRVQKGLRGEIRALAHRQGKTTNAWLNGLIRAAMASERGVRHG